MNEVSPGVRELPNDVSLFAIGTALIRRRRLILALTLIGVVLGVARALTEETEYESQATFIPQVAQTTSGLAAAASQFGINLGSASGGWGPAMYIALLHSRALLLPIAYDTISVTEAGGRRIPVMELLNVGGSNPEQREVAAVGGLGKMIQGVEDKRLGAVMVVVTTKWPSVSRSLAERLVRRVNEFNLQTRRSQATSELQFFDSQTEASNRALQRAESELGNFYQSNREVGSSPKLMFERDRLQREVTRLNMLYTTWLQSREDARIRQIRDVPVITIIEEPRTPFSSVSKQTTLKGIIGGAAGALVGVFIAFLAYGLAAGRQTARTEAEEFFQAVQEMKPRFLNRGQAPGSRS